MKILLVFALALAVLPVQTDAQSNKTQQASKRDKPALPTASAVSQNSPVPQLQPADQKHVQADVRVVSTPEKDAYDRAAIWINLALAVIGAFGIGGAFITLRKLERQTRATEEAVLEAKAARASAENTAKRQLRAYMAVTGATMVITSLGSIEAMVIVANSGQTPAYSVKSWSHAIILPYPAGNSLKPPESGFPQGTSVIASQKHQELPVRTISGADSADSAIATLSNRQVAYYVHGRIEYVDIFKDRHFLNFRMFSGGPQICKFEPMPNGNYGGKLSMDSEGNDGD